MYQGANDGISYYTAIPYYMAKDALYIIDFLSKKAQHFADYYGGTSLSLSEISAMKRNDGTVIDQQWIDSNVHWTQTATPAGAKDYYTDGDYGYQSYENMKNVIKSYSRISSKGTAKNYFYSKAPVENPQWNAETKTVYENILSKEYVNWGAFSYSMPADSASLTPGHGSYDTFFKNSQTIEASMESKWGHPYEIYPTYSHLGSKANTFVQHHFPLQMAQALAGGNITDGKPILQFTFQYTTNNNIVADQVTPIYDILRGKYDDEFREIATDMKTYAKPIMSITELAQKIDIAEATILRYCRKIGYKGFQDFKLSLSQELGDSLEVDVNDNAGFLENLVSKTLSKDAGLLPKDQAEEVAKKILAANKVCCFGVGNSSIAGVFFTARLLKLGIEVVSLSDPHYQAIIAANLTKKDFLILVSVSGGTKDIIDVAKIARTNGVPIMAFLTVPIKPAGVTILSTPRASFAPVVKKVALKLIFRRMRSSSRLGN